MSRRKHITRLLNADLIFERSIRVLDYSFREGVHGEFMVMHGCYILTGHEFEIIIIDKRIVENLRALGELKNVAIKVDDFGNITLLS